VHWLGDFQFQVIFSLILCFKNKLKVAHPNTPFQEIDNLQFPTESISNPYVHLIDTVNHLLYLASSDSGENAYLLKIDLQTFSVVASNQIPFY
jgi:hypothetical protein